MKLVFTFDNALMYKPDQHIINSDKETSKDKGNGKSQEKPHQVSLRPDRQKRQGPAKH